MNKNDQSKTEGTPHVGSSAVLGRWQQTLLLVGAMIVINAGMSERDPVWKIINLVLAILIVWVVLLARDKRPNASS